MCLRQDLEEALGIASGSVRPASTSIPSAKPIEASSPAQNQHDFCPVTASKDAIRSREKSPISHPADVENSRKKSGNS